MVAFGESRPLLPPKTPRNRPLRNILHIRPTGPHQPLDHPDENDLVCGIDPEPGSGCTVPQVTAFAHCDFGLGRIGHDRAVDAEFISGADSASAWKAARAKEKTTMHFSERLKFTCAINLILPQVRELRRARDWR
jgi:hypothetical protein